MDIVVLISGGVDSIVAAFILKQRGHKVTGVTLDMHTLCGKDIQRAKEATKRLGIKHKVLDVRDDFEKSVINYLTGEYGRGRTPNPCAVCNKLIKFGVAMDRLNFDKYATGHYVRTCYNNNPQIKKGIDREKDQSYFLAMIDRERIKDLLFPLGNLEKETVIRIARELGIDKNINRESQDLCFTEKGYLEFMFNGREDLPGGIIDTRGNFLGKHKGLFRYTIGQRKGIGRPDRSPYYVVAIDHHSNTLVVGRNEDLYSDVFFCNSPNWLIEPPPKRSLSLEIKIRYRHKQVKGIFYPDSNKVEMEAPQRAITPGQVAAFYSDEILLGGAWIASA